MLAMEEAISGNDEYLANLVHVSFVENLMGERELITGHRYECVFPAFDQRRHGL
jgi:hypothetical protein